METRANFTVVGIFVLVFVGGIVAWLIWLSDLGKNQGSEYFTIYFRQHSLSGLQKDSYVLMKGIKIGSVSHYQISDQDIGKVKVTLRLDQGTPIKTDTRAIISRNLLTGLAVVELVGSSQNTEPLVAVLPNEDFPIIPEGESRLDKLADSLPQFLEEASQAVNRVKLFASDENIQSASKTIKNLELVSQSVADRRGEIESLITSLDATSKEIAKASKEFSEFAKSLDNNVSGLKNDSAALMTELRESLTSIQDKFANVAKSFTNASQVFSHEVATITQSITGAAESISKTVEEFENPRKIITGPNERSLGPGEQLEK